jgi:hypothetical protein
MPEDLRPVLIRNALLLFCRVGDQKALNTVLFLQFDTVRHPPTHRQEVDTLP